MKEKKIAELQMRENQGEIALFYFDESGVSTVPNIPYGWQQIGKTVALPSKQCKRVNILGFLNRENEFYGETVDGWVNSDHVIACFDNFATQLQMPTVVIVDNASMHRSKKFKARFEEWEKCGLTVFYLPTYSPELNLIEILWRFLKYQWISLSAYESRAALKKNVIEILNGIGTKYTITFA